MLNNVLHCTTMTEITKIIGIRATLGDKRLISKLCKKLGVSTSQVIRLGLRALATKEGVAA